MRGHDNTDPTLPQSKQNVYVASKIEVTNNYNTVTLPISAPDPPSQNFSEELPIHYITTHYENLLATKLGIQKEKRKKRAKIAIYGTTGSGKTTIAYQFLIDYLQAHPDHIVVKFRAETESNWRYDIMEWIHALHPDLSQRLLEISNDLTMSEEDKSNNKETLITHRIHQTLKSRQWCILLDNWDGIEYAEIERYFEVGQGILLITTQDSNMFFEEDECRLDTNLGLLFIDENGLPNNQQSVHLLEKILSKLKNEQRLLIENSSARNLLLDFLNHLPLGITVASYYIFWENEESIFGFEDYQKLLSGKFDEIVEDHKKSLSKKPNVPREYEYNYVAFKSVKTQEAAVALSLEKIIFPKKQPINYNLWHLLCFCGFLSSDHIPKLLLKDYLRAITSLQEDGDIIKYLRNILCEIKKYSLFQDEKSTSTDNDPTKLHFHRVIQKVIRDKYWPQLLAYLNEELLLSTTMEDLFRQMEVAFSYSFTPAVDNQDFSIIRDYVPHVEAWWTYHMMANLSPLMLCRDLVIAHRHLGNYTTAETLLNNTLEDLITPSEENTVFGKIILQNELANIYVLLNRMEDAEALYYRIMNQLIDSDSESNINITRIKMNLASLLLEKREIDAPEKAKELAKEVKKTYEDAIVVLTQNAVEEIEIAEARQNLGIALNLLELYEEAITYFDGALVVKTDKYGEHHPCVAKTKKNKANSLFGLKENVEADNLLQATVASMKIHYGVKHIEVAKVIYNRAKNLIMIGELDVIKISEASVLLKECRPIFEKENSKKDLIGCENLRKEIHEEELYYRVYCEYLPLKNYAEVIVILNELIHLNSKRKLHYYILKACAHHMLGKIEENSIELMNADQLFQKSLTLLNGKVEYANYLRDQGRYDEALKHLDNALKQEQVTHLEGAYYTISEAAILPEPLKNRIEQSGESIDIPSAHIFAYYLKIQCLLKITSIQKEIILQTSLEFHSHLQSLNEDHPIYFWLYNDIYRLCEEREILIKKIVGNNVIIRKEKFYSENSALTFYNENSSATQKENSNLFHSLIIEQETQLN